jgi:hypothetical protein
MFTLPSLPDSGPMCQPEFGWNAAMNPVLYDQDYLGLPGKEAMNYQRFNEGYLWPRRSARVVVIFFFTVCGLLLFLTPLQMSAVALGERPGFESEHLVETMQAVDGSLPPLSELQPELCEPGVAPDLAPPLPASNYFLTARYGWFDAHHFDAGNPARLIEDVRRAAVSGAGIISVEQDVRNRTTGYTAHYLVAGNIPPGEIVDIALGIYLDWSFRFEEWQGQPPRSLVGPLTSFAVEDLPSHYVGFFAAAHELSIAQVFACYLGTVEEQESGPPNFVFFDNLGQVDNLLLAPVMQQLMNTEFRPLVQSEGGWHHVAWPPAMQMVPSQASRQYWQFESDETWYFDWQ